MAKDFPLFSHKRAKAVKSLPKTLWNIHICWRSVFVEKRRFDVRQERFNAFPQRKTCVKQLVFPTFLKNMRAVEQIFDIFVILKPWW